MDLPWDDLRTVLAVARAGSLSGAARTLGVEHSTIYRRINEVEARVAPRLFERHRTGYATTAQGDRLVEAATVMEEAANAALRQVSGADTRVAGFPNARWLATAYPDAKPALRFDSTVAMARAAAAGVGLAALPLFAGAQEPGLVRVGEILPIPPMTVWVLRHADLAQNARVRALATFLGDRVADALAEAEAAAPRCTRGVCT